MATRPTTTAATTVYQARNAAARPAAVATRPATTAARNDATAQAGWSGSCASHDSTHAKTAADHPATYSRDQHGAEAAVFSNDPTSKAAVLG